MPQSWRQAPVLVLPLPRAAEAEKIPRRLMTPMAGSRYCLAAVTLTADVSSLAK